MCFSLCFGREREQDSHWWSLPPWCYEQSLIVLEEPSGIGDYSRLSFSKTLFWIQLHNVPIYCIRKEVAFVLGSMIGIVEEVDGNQSGLCVLASILGFGLW